MGALPPWVRTARGGRLSAAPGGNGVLPPRALGGLESLGLAGESIPLPACIIHLADRVDVLVPQRGCVRQYRPGVIKQVLSLAGQVFDPSLAEQTITFPLGSHCGIIVLRFPNEASVASVNRELLTAVALLSEEDVRWSVVVLEPGRRVVTAVEDLESVRCALRMGVLDYLLKPAGPAELADAVRRAADIAAQEQRERANKSVSAGG